MLVPEQQRQVHAGCLPVHAELHERGVRPRRRLRIEVPDGVRAGPDLLFGGLLFRPPGVHVGDDVQRVLAVHGGHGFRGDGSVGVLERELMRG